MVTPKYPGIPGCAETPWYAVMLKYLDMQLIRGYNPVFRKKRGQCHPLFYLVYMIYGVGWMVFIHKIKLN